MLGEGAMPPLWQYLTRVRSQTSPLLPPKDTDPRTLWLFPCKPAGFKGPQEGAMIAIVDP
jgi:hypothetical protein